MKIKQEGINSYYETEGGKYYLHLKHACSSCELNDEEYAWINGYNEGIRAAVKVIEKMELEIRDLNNQIAIKSINGT
jgi:hypothetical protein